MVDLTRLSRPDLETHLRDFRAGPHRLADEEPDADSALFASLRHLYPEKARDGAVFLTPRGLRFWASAFRATGTLAGGILHPNVHLVHVRRNLGPDAARYPVLVTVQGLESRRIDTIEWCEWAENQVGVWRLRVEEASAGRVDALLAAWARLRADLRVLRDASCARCSVPDVAAACIVCDTVICENCASHQEYARTGRRGPVCPPCRAKTMSTSGWDPLGLARGAADAKAHTLDVVDAISKEIEQKVGRIEQVTAKSLRRTALIVMLYLFLALSTAGISLLHRSLVSSGEFTLFAGLRIGLLSLGLPLVLLGTGLSVADYVRSARRQHAEFRQPWMVGLLSYLTGKLGPGWLVMIAALFLAWIAALVLLFVYA